MALSLRPKEPGPSYAGRQITIIADASWGSPLTYTLDHDPREDGIRVGSYLDDGEHGLLAGRVVAITDNIDQEDWFSVASEWYVRIERPWKQDMLATSLGACKIEWMEDTLFPRLGTILAAPDDSYFRRGDIVRVS